MKRMITAVIACIVGVSAMSAEPPVKSAEKTFKDDMSALVYYPDSKEKLPVVIFAHNGGKTKEKWEDYPGAVAAKGFFVLSIGYSSVANPTHFSDVILNVRKEYAAVADFSRVSFVGGCHGGAIMVSMLNGGDTPALKTSEIKTIVLLSLSEKRLFPEKHCPILTMYSKDDRLGPGYQKSNKTIAEEYVSAPKKIVAMSAAPHGHELVVDSSTKNEVRAEVDGWLLENGR